MLAARRMMLSRRVAATVVQHKSGWEAGGTSLTVTLDSAPTPGNVLFAFVFTKSSRISSMSPGTGWTEQAQDTNGDADVDVFSRIVASGDGAGWTSTLNTADTMALALIEIAGSDGNPNGWSYPTATGAGTVTNTLTISSGLLVLVAATSWENVATSASGYTADEQQTNPSAILGHTTGTGSSQTFTTTFSGGSASSVQVVVEVQN